MKAVIFKRVLFLLLCLSPIFATVAYAQTIAYGLDSKIWGMDVKTQQKVILINPPSVPYRLFAPSWSGDGKTIAAVIDGNIWLADVPTRKSRILIRANHQRFVGTPAWSKDGKSLYVCRFKDEGDVDGGLWQINVQNGQAHRLIQPEDVDGPMHLNPLVSADGHYLISSGMMDGETFFYAIDLRSNKPIKLPNQQIVKFVTCYTFDKSSNMLFIGGYAGDGIIGKGPGGVWRWDLTTNTCSPWILKGQTIDEISISPNGKTISIVSIFQNEKGEDINSFYTYSISGKKSATIKVPGDMSHITWLDNESFVAENAPKGDPDHTNIIRYNIRTGKSHIMVKGGYGVAVAVLRPH